MKVQVYLNEAPGHFDGFNPFRAALRLAVEFEIDAEAPHTFGEEAEGVYTGILSEVYTQLNVGGDLYPAEPYTFEYRKAGNRSLSVGDLVVLTHDSYSTITAAYSVEKVGWKRRWLDNHDEVPLIVRRALDRFWDVPDPFIPVARHDLTVDGDGMFQTVRPTSNPHLHDPEWVK